MRAGLEIHLKSLTENIKALRAFAKKFSNSEKPLIKCLSKTEFFCPMIKAEAYGLGASVLAKVFQKSGVSKAGVISVEEALEIQDSSLAVYIFGPYSSKDVESISKYSFVPVVGNWEDLKLLAGFKKKPIDFHIEFNADMNRTGFNVSSAEKLMDYISSQASLNLTGLASHFSTGENLALSILSDVSSSFFYKMTEVFNKFQKRFSNRLLDFHCLNSSGFLSLCCHGLYQSSLGFRPGISLYGVKPDIKFFNAEAKEKYQSLVLQPVLCLKSFVVQTHWLSKGEGVSYGGAWRAKRKSLVAVISMGYADGLPYQASQGLKVLLRGKQVSVVGKVCMDFFMVDATDAVEEGEIQRGEPVVIFGSQGSAELSLKEQAEKTNTIPYEWITRLGNRVKRIYIS